MTTFKNNNLQTYLLLHNTSFGVKKYTQDDCISLKNAENNYLPLPLRARVWAKVRVIDRKLVRSNRYNLKINQTITACVIR